MRLSLGKSYKINLGNYESVEVSAHVTLDEEDYDDDLPDGMSPDERMDWLRQEGTRYMDDYLEPELKRLAELSQADATMLTPPAPPRRERTTRRRSTN